jgi:hypothetical protein
LVHLFEQKEKWFLSARIFGTDGTSGHGDVDGSSGEKTS